MASITAPTAVFNRIYEYMDGSLFMEAVLLHNLCAGIGLAGLCCAAAGAHVMLTDIPSVSEGILACNVTSNVESYADAKLRMEDSDEQAFRGSRSGSSWHNSQPLGRGSCAVGSLDFTKPMAEQVHVYP